MPKTRSQKEKALTDFSAKLKEAKSAVFVNFENLKVKEIEELRKNCRQEGVDYLVTKKTLMKIALKKAGLAVKPEVFDKSAAAVFGINDEAAPARIVQTFAKTHEALNVFGGILEGKFVGREKILELAKLPSREELLAKVLGSIKAPVSGFVNVLAGNLRGLVGVLSAIKESK
ncbi:MAG: 50S ribosomal protein L10 [Candidatus Buchananbacteria bacterium RIFCSPHIGHO2_02_FULL_45_11b]|uniref:Large ribosomal subunit protein uL10 n=4 Tax=Candidatus Buchananiibacteriota TaxID=1817903 RepID=A0A1G1YL99_9BACT|nr:MAG: 50S ribosomal protein L10 [Candidatus Buchananbacteria bacterium RIFCSPHIGHO2_01_FULL_46_12]OGY52237.1 MAG: 50S ribosomal protein L10 [Candidatus Buchananbacteria bacterium RIFCSPHIGHO2_02_FULL_45_11b]OGY54353.1 MAG: 50S ribosomal protein L10 [Candidatus Buchananbacteria bacterium RIFCSPLOWO2_01_FULL_45_31]OGY57619.1 MAG: 50S ribosomal protein L10 [Candidatus Buchananbacteria bacterium RIFCSPLOWO2_02_FULL_46_11b]